MKILDEQCAVCGGQLVEKEVEKLLRGGRNMGVIKVYAEVCLHCGERFYSTETIRKFETIEHHLEHNDTQGFEILGSSYQVA